MVLGFGVWGMFVFVTVDLYWDWDWACIPRGTRTVISR